MRQATSIFAIFLSLNSWAQINQSSSRDLIIGAVLGTIEAAFTGFAEAEQPINSIKLDLIEAGEPQKEHFEVYYSDTVFYAATLADYGYETIFKIHKELIVDNYTLELIDKYSEIYVVGEYLDLEGNWNQVYYEAEKINQEYESLIFIN